MIAMTLWDRTRSSKLPFIDQEDRVCSNCNARFLSGVIVVERGYPTRALCKKCAHLHAEKGWENNNS
jgi:hypothetical protein